MNTVPSYLPLSSTGELARRAGRAYAMMKECRMCPRDCGVNRLLGKRGVCRTGKIAGVASANLHFGEEPPITGSRGSGTIFFTGCNLRCRFCQNYPISQMGHGKPAPPHALAAKMLNLQKRGAHNINLVTPSHVVPQFLAGLAIAAKEGLKIPIVYNSSGYEGIAALKLLDGAVDVYMPDIKYAAREAATRCSDAPDYWDAVRPAMKEMFRQVGALRVDEEGIATRGMLIRHLVLPGGLASSKKVFEFIATELSTDIPVNLMSQYFPVYYVSPPLMGGDEGEGEQNQLLPPPPDLLPQGEEGLRYSLLNRKITREEFAEAEEALHLFGLTKGWIQEMD